jgi:outer membrane protein W
MPARSSVLAFLFGAFAAAASAQQYGIYRPYLEVKVRSPYVQMHEGDETFSRYYDWHMANSKANETDVTVFLTAEFALEWSLAKSRNDFSLSDHYGHTSQLGSLELRMENFVLQLHYPTENRIKPYFGLGANRTKAQGSFSAQYPSPFYGFDYSGRGYKWGWVVQAGVDFLMRWNIVINVDFKYIWNDTLIQSVRNSGPTKGQTTNYDLAINPALFGLGVGFRW